MALPSLSQLSELRRQWGSAQAPSRSREQVFSFYRHVADPDSDVDERTWDDLAMDEVFARMDRATCEPGRQVLYRQLRGAAAGEDELAERTRQQGVFTSDTGYRERIQGILARLSGRGADGIGEIVVGPYPPVPPKAAAFYLLSAASVGIWIGFFFIHQLLAIALPLALLNVYICSGYRRQAMTEFAALAQIVTLLAIGESLAVTPDPHRLPQLKTLRASLSWSQPLRRRLAFLTFNRAALPDILESTMEYLNMLLLFDLITYISSLKLLRNQRKQLREVFEAIGSLDAAMAVASYRASGVRCAVPTLHEHRGISVRGLRHPLIENAVGNDLELNERSALVAGPNMAGKTAFIRTVGINLLLAQSVHLCLAESAALPRARVFSAIRREDNLIEGDSYFFTEVKQIGEFVRAADDPGLKLFLIDEIFRGTNTVERIAAAAAVLAHLAKTQTVLATTHDQELGQLLASRFDLMHFCDQVVDGKYGFNFKLLPGPVTSRNALRLLQISGYPSAVVAEAEEYAARVNASNAE